MLVKDSKGREAEIELSGPADDVSVEAACYTDSGDDVPESELGWILDTYAAEIDFERFEAMVCAAEDWADRDR